MTKHLHTDYTITFHSTLNVKKPAEKTHDKRVSFGDKRISSAEDFGGESGKKLLLSWHFFNHSMSIKPTDLHGNSSEYILV